MIYIRAQRENWSNSIEFAVFDRIGNGSSISIAKNILFEVGEAGVEVQPVCSLSPEHAQQLMDDLWVCGLRPSEGTGSAGALKATQDHLADMRKLVFSMVEKEK